MDAHLIPGTGEMRRDFFVYGMYVLGFVGCAVGIGGRHFLFVSFFLFLSFFRGKIRGWDRRGK